MTQKRTLSVDLNGLVMDTPVMVASGCGGTGPELPGLVDVRRLGGIVTRSVTLKPREGAPAPRVVESPSGIVWSTGLQNPGIDEFIAGELGRMTRLATRLFVSISGGSLEEFVRVTSLLQHVEGVSAIEVRLSEPDEELERAVLGAYPDRAAEIVGAVARMSLVPVFAKLPLSGPRMLEVARAVARSGAHGLTIADAPAALSIDLNSSRPALGGSAGWLSGPAVRPLTLRAVHDVALLLPEVPIIAVGGIRSGRDAAEMLIAGAWAVQVGTQALIDASSLIGIARDIGDLLKARGLQSPADLRAVGRGASPVSEEA